MAKSKKLNGKTTKVIETYDMFAKQYAEYTFPRLLQFQLTEFCSKIKKNAKILDVGCGSGRDVQYFMEEGFKVTGIDLSKKLIKEAKARVNGGKFVCKDMRNTKYKDNSFDAVWCHATFCHIEKKNAVATLKELYRILKPGGILYMGLREGEGEGEREYMELGNNPVFFAFYKQIELENMLEEADFKIVKSFVDKDDHSGWLNVMARKNGELKEHSQ